MSQSPAPRSVEPGTKSASAQPVPNFAGRRFPLLAPIVLAFALSTLGSVIVLTLPSDRLQEPYGSMIAVLGFVSAVAAALSLLVYIPPCRDAMDAGLRYFAGMGVRIMLTALATALAIGYSDWPVAQAALVATAWYVALLFLVEVPFVARFVAGFDARASAVTEVPPAE